MHLALTLNPFEDTDLLYAQQLGVTWIVGDVPSWDGDTLGAARNRVSRAGLTLASLGCLPTPLLAEALSGRSDGEAALDRICGIIAGAGKVGIPALGYRWPVPGLETAAAKHPGRGQSVSTIHSVRDGGPTGNGEARERQWEALTRFLTRVMPAARDAGVRLVYRTDLAIASLPEDARILDSVAELDRLIETAGSSSHGLDLDHGFVTRVLAAPTDPGGTEPIQHFGRREAIFAVRVRNLRRVDGGAEEHYLDEDRAALVAALQAYRGVGFKGALCPIPSPEMTDDTEWRHKGAAFDIGYLRALLQALG